MIISEILPNPIGKDADGEWIEIFNGGSAPLNLGGWSIKDASGKTFRFKDGVLRQGEYAVFDYKTTKISLNNQGEKLELYDAGGSLADEFEFSGVPKEGWSVARVGSGVTFTDHPTAGEANTAGANGQFSELISGQLHALTAAAGSSGLLSGFNILLAAAAAAFVFAFIGSLVVSKFKNEAL